MAAKVGRRDAYVGETANQIREGFGVYNYDNKFFRYEGEWKGGKKHGHGKLVMADGSYYEGMFENGEIEGHGYRYFASAGNTYSGEFKMGELTGQGIMKYHNGDVYEGMWHRNKRSGFGVFKHEDNSVYQGYSHNNMRHGEGTFIYSNGDRYDGDWVNDKRQGHGELRCQDGSLYDGQWLNDLFNGQGTMKHSSGMIYEGMWVNGHPANMAQKLVITVTPEDILQGVYFNVQVECQTEHGTQVMSDNGRELQVTAGFKNMLLTPIDGKTKTSMTGTSSLFDVIEDVEEKPVQTPFGYDIVGFPITDQMPDRESLGDLPEPSFLSSHQGTSLTEASEGVGGGEDKEPVEGSGEEEKKKEEGSEEVKPIEGEEGEPRAEREETSTEQQTEETAAETEKVEDTQRPEESLPPPVESQRTENGKVSFENLILPGATPMYRPYMVMDEEARMEKAKQMAKTGKKVAKEKMVQEEQKAKAKKFGDERYARPGTYVIMVQDVTNPPFLGQRLDPGFLEVKLALPKKAKKVIKKERGPKNRGPHSCPLCSDIPNIQDLTVKERMDAVRSNLSFIQEDDNPHELYTPRDPSQGQGLGKFSRTPQVTSVAGQRESVRVKRVLGDVGNNMKGIIHISHPALDDGAGAGYPARSRGPTRPVAHSIDHLTGVHEEMEDDTEESSSEYEEEEEEESDNDEEAEDGERYLDF